MQSARPLALSGLEPTLGEGDGLSIPLEKFITFIKFINFSRPRTLLDKQVVPGEFTRARLETRIDRDLWAYPTEPLAQRTGPGTSGWRLG